MEEDSLSLPHLIINHMIKAIEPIKFTCNVPYGMLLTLVFKHFGVYEIGLILLCGYINWISWVNMLFMFRICFVQYKI